MFTPGESEREQERGGKKRIRVITTDPSVSDSPQEIVLDGAERPVILSPCSDPIPRYIHVLLKSSKDTLPHSYRVSEFLSDVSSEHLATWLSLPNSLWIITACVRHFCCGQSQKGTDCHQSVKLSSQGSMLSGLYDTWLLAVANCFTCSAMTLLSVGALLNLLCYGLRLLSRVSLDHEIYDS